jgi:hypothetical protein
MIALTLVNTNQVKVVINKATVGTFTPTSMIIVLGQAGNDTIAVDKKLPQARILIRQRGQRHARRLPRADIGCAAPAALAQACRCAGDERL